MLGGRVENGDGNLPVIRNGICYNTTGVLDELGSDYYNMPIGVYEPGKTYYFSMNIEYLSPNTTYYVQAYAENAEGINFSSQGTFTTLSAVSIPAVSTNIITSIVSTTATGGGIVINEGSSSVTKRGICWGTSINPTITKPLTPTSTGGRTENGSGLGEFSSSITNATGNTLYYVRAYATNSTGTAYGINQTFTTLGVLPIVETETTSAITLNSATSGGTVTNQGTSAVSERGICYSTSINPDTSQPTVTTPTGGKILSGTGLGSFSCNLTGLNSGVVYYIRAYAINSSGTSYGINQSFTTIQQTMATLSSSLFAETSTTIVVRWTLTLSQPSTTEVIIPITITNGDNTGTTTSGFVLSAGQITANENTVYSKLSSSYTAYCDFGTMPYGFTGTNSVSYLIPAFEVVCSVPTLTTDSIGSITQTTASGGGNVTYYGGCNVTSRGLCWSTSPNPTTLDSWIVSGSGIGIFTANIIGLSPGTTYYVRAFAVNSSGTGYGNEVVFTTTNTSCPSVGDFYGGGIVAYLFQSGDNGYVSGECHGIIASEADISTGIAWWNGSYTTIGSTLLSIGYGSQNSDNILASQGSGSYAASICLNLLENGENDWVLPSFYELEKLYYARNLIGGFVISTDPLDNSNYYWTSSELSNTEAYRILFYELYYVWGTVSKGNSTTRVRPIRYF